MPYGDMNPKAFNVSAVSVTKILDEPSPLRAALATPLCGERTFELLGVRITDARMERAVQLMYERMLQRGDRAGALSIVNAHTLNLATSNPNYRRVLNSSDYVFGDGTGVRWGARLQGLKLQANLVGTDLIPRYFAEYAHQGHSYYLLGSDAVSNSRAATYARENFSGWRLAGAHHGYLNDPRTLASTISDINRTRPDLLLVAMGNPLQETWIARHRDQLEVGLCVGVGGLFDIWAGNLRRPSPLFRDHGCEWLGILLQQPKKSRRYLIGNPLYLARIAREQLWRSIAKQAGNGSAS